MPKANHLVLVGAFLFFQSTFATPAHAGEGLITTGETDARLAPFDELMTKFVAENKIPGASLAVVRNEKLVYARGFGYADREANEPVKPNSLFRIASVSKPFTSAAVLQLVEKGKLRLDDKAFAILRLQPHAEPGATVDPRLKDATVRELLQHTGGFDRSNSFDPMFRSVEIAQAFRAAPPASPEMIIRYMLGKPLDFDPGTKYAYSNFGFCVLGRVIERISGQPYEQYVQKHVLEPLGIRDMRIGRSLAQGRAPGEVKYYEGKNNNDARSVFAPTVGKSVPIAYGGWCIEAMDAHGGWIASAIDLARFATAFDDRAHSPILSEKSIETLFARPPGPPGEQNGKPKPTFYGCGWSVRPTGRPGKANTWHTGSLDGTGSLLVRRADGLDWAVLFNTRNTADGKATGGAIDSLVHKAADAVKEWPEKDLFATKLPPSP